MMAKTAIFKKYLKYLLVIGSFISLFGCELSKQTKPITPTISEQKTTISSEAVCQEFMRYAEINKAGRYFCRDGYVTQH